MRGDQPPSVQRRWLCCRRRRCPLTSHQILIGQLGNSRLVFTLGAPDRVAPPAADPSPSNRARQKARQPASPRPRLEVRIQSPPAVSQQTFCSSQDDARSIPAAVPGRTGRPDLVTWWRSRQTYGRSRHGGCTAERPSHGWRSPREVAAGVRVLGAHGARAGVNFGGARQ